MPFEFGQVLEIPKIFWVEISLFSHHFLPIQRQSCQFSHSFVWKFNPSLSKADLLVPSSFDSIFPGPIILREQINPFYKIVVQQFFDIVGFHVWWDPWHVANSFVTLLLPIFIHLFLKFFLIIKRVLYYWYWFWWGIWVFFSLFFNIFLHHLRLILAFNILLFIYFNSLFALLHRCYECWN